LYDALKGNKSEATIILVSGAPHGFIPPTYPSELDCYPSLERLFSIMSDFFDVHIKNEDPERFADIILKIKNVADTSIQYDISHNLNDPSGLKSTKSESVTLNSGDIHESSIQFETLISQHFEPSYVISPSTYEKLVEVERTHIVYKSIIAILFS
jgi:hypothetical protein